MLLLTSAGSEAKLFHRRPNPRVLFEHAWQL
jgi:hypothetical protein